MKRKKWVAVTAGLFLSACLPFTAMAGDGYWVQDGNSWRYSRPDGGMAKDSWEDVDGEWYYFGADGLMKTGWQKVDNIRYFLNADGSLASGWQKYTGDNGTEKWYYYDENGNAKTGWFEDGGKWYYFGADGTMTADTARTIDGAKYVFHADGSLRANEYDGFRYIDVTGQEDPSHDVKAEDVDGRKASVESDLRDEIADRLNALPKGWLKKFVDDGWQFVYCPDHDYFSVKRTDDGDDPYYVYYKLNAGSKTLCFSDPDYLWQGFGEYVYRIDRENLDSDRFTWKVDDGREEIEKMGGLPDGAASDYRLAYGVLLSEYLTEEGNRTLDTDFHDLYWCLERSIARRDMDGRSVKIQ